MWEKQQLYWEQPEVQFKDELILQILTEDGVSMQYSTIKSINEMSMNPLPMPYLAMSKLDSNSDGKVDQYDMTLNFKGDPSKIRRIDLLATFDYFVGYRLKMLTVGMIHVSIDTP